MLNDGQHTHAYDAHNMIVTVDGGMDGYFYGQGSRVIKVAGAVETRYYFGVGEYVSSAWSKLYVNLGSEKLIEYSGGTTHFFHADHPVRIPPGVSKRDGSKVRGCKASEGSAPQSYLMVRRGAGSEATPQTRAFQPSQPTGQGECGLRSPRVRTDMSATEDASWDNLPFGETWTSSGMSGDQHKFTGHLRDDETGNDYAGARYYANWAGRWLAADSVRGPITDPQRINRYRYARNDPINWVDRNGAQEEWTSQLPPEAHGQKCFHGTFKTPPPTPATVTNPPGSPISPFSGGYLFGSNEPGAGVQFTIEIGSGEGQGRPPGLEDMLFRPCKNPKFDFDSLSSATKGLLGANAESTFNSMSDSQKATFLNIAAAMRQAGIDLGVLSFVSVDDHSIHVQGFPWSNELAFLQSVVGAGFHGAGAGARQNVTLASLNVKWEDNGVVSFDIDLGGFATDVAGSLIHIIELGDRNPTNPLAVYRLLGMRGDASVTPEYECDL